MEELRLDFLKWLRIRFPKVPLLFILRHPCAVVLSRKELGWPADSDLEPFLQQESLIEDFLHNNSITTTTSSAVITGEDKISRWKNHLSSKEIARIFRIVQESGLDHIYGDSMTPKTITILERPAGSTNGFNQIV